MELIESALEDFLSGHVVSSVSFAEGEKPPPDLAYMVNFPRISVTFKGVDRMEVGRLENSGEIAIPVGEAVVIPPNCWNRPSWNGEATVLNILVGQKQLGLSLISFTGHCTEPPRGCRAAIPSAVNLAERHLVQALLDVGVRRSATAAPAILNALLGCLLDNFRQSAPKVASKAAVTYDAITFYLQQNFAFPLSRQSVADHFHLSPGHVSRLFRREGLSGFNEYLNRVRIDRAKFLLKKHNLSLDEIAVRCGYSDSAYFCRVFKRLTKHTPTSYRNQI